MRRAILALPLLLLALVPSSGAQTLPSCGSEQHRSDSQPRPRDVRDPRLLRGAPASTAPRTRRRSTPRPTSASRVRREWSASSAGTVTAVSWCDLRRAAPFSLTVSWDQQELDEPPTCSASVTYDFTVRRRAAGRAPAVKGKPVEALPGPGYGFVLRFLFATQGRNRNAWDRGRPDPAEGRGEGGQDGEAAQPDAGAGHSRVRPRSAQGPALDGRCRPGPPRAPAGRSVSRGGIPGDPEGPRAPWPDGRRNPGREEPRQLHAGGQLQDADLVREHVRRTASSRAGNPGWGTVSEPATAEVAQPSLRPTSAASSVTATRSCSSVSRSRRVTVSSSIVWWSMVTPNGVPISSWRR